MPPADRPVLDLPRSPLEAGLEAIALVGVTMGFAQLAVAWSGLPPVVPVHFDLSGEPNGWGPRWLLWIVPAISAVVWGGLSWAQRLGPHRFNYPWPITAGNAAAQYRLARTLLVAVKAATAALLALMIRQQILGALGRPNPGLGWLVAFFLVQGAIATIYYLRARRAR